MLGSLAFAAGLLSPSVAKADPILRHQADARGDVVVFGSTMTYDCGSSVAPPLGTTPACAGQLETDDSAGDLYWRDDLANKDILPEDARTSATLDLPLGSQVTYARLYWSALKVGNAADQDVVLDWQAGPQTTITADFCHPTIPFPFVSHPDWFYYQCAGDATSYVSDWGAGDFRVTGIQAIPLADTLVHLSYSAWTLVVFYENPNDDLRNLALFDGFERVDPENNVPSVQATLSGFLVPPGFKAKMAAFMYEGDMAQPSAPPGDKLTMNGVALSNASNPVDDFFNSSRTSELGVPYSGSQDVPMFSGEPDSMSGYDLDTVDVKSCITAGDTSAVVGAEAVVDKFILGGFVTSITNLAPDFNNLTKSVVDLNGGGVMPNDILEYAISGTNTGNDDAVDVVVSDTLKPGIEYVPGSLTLVAGGAPGTKTDVSGDDEGEYVSGTKTVVVRAGTGATATQGGTIAVGEMVTVKFRAKVTATKGKVSNTGSLEAAGASGGTKKIYDTDSDPATPGRQSTDIAINECSSDTDCTGTKPHCDTATHTCLGCKTDADCTDAKNPACQSSGACAQCSATNDNLCIAPTPACNTLKGLCSLCTQGTNGDASQCATSPDGPVCIGGPSGSVFCGCDKDTDCGTVDSGRVCDTSVQKCIDGCRGQGGNHCSAELQCTSPDTTIGDCIVPGVDAGVGDDGGQPAEAVPQAAGDDGGCSCSTLSKRSWGNGMFVAAAALGAAALLRRKRQS